MISPSPGSTRPAHKPVGSRILICGASGNLGNHTANELARSGVTLSLWGRNIAKLEAVASACRDAGAVVSIRAIDLTDIDGAIHALREEDDTADFDSAFFLSGCGDTREPGRIVESASQIARLGILNYVAPAALAAELGERMANRRSGRIVIVGTAAATHPLPFAAGYASSKCGLAQFTHALRIALHAHGVMVTLVSPGFFAAQTPGAYGYARPGEISARRVAQRMITAAERGQSEVITPGIFVLLRWLGHGLPRALRDAILRKLPSP